jgi:hypothetical protein
LLYSFILRHVRSLACALRFGRIASTKQLPKNECLVARRYSLYDVNGKKEREVEYKSNILAALHEYICFDDFSAKAGCPESVMKKVSDMHEGRKTYCILRSELDMIR